MKRLLVIPWLLCALKVMAQTPLRPLEPFTPMVVLDGSMQADGVWGVGGHLEFEHEVTSSSIFCWSADHTCTESVSTVDFDGDAFQNTAGFHTYNIEHWTKDEIVASTVEGDCRVHQVLKFDLKGKKVLWSEALSEPMGKMPDGFDCSKVKPRQTQLYRQNMFRIK